MANFLVKVNPTAAEIAQFGAANVFSNLEAAIEAADSGQGGLNQDDVITIRGVVPLEGVGNPINGNVVFGDGANPRNLTIVGEEGATVEAVANSGALAQLEFQNDTFNVSLSNFVFDGKDGPVAGGINSNAAILFENGNSGSLNGVTITDFGNDAGEGTGLEILSNDPTGITLNVTNSSFTSLEGNAIDLDGAGTGDIALSVVSSTTKDNNEGGKAANAQDIEVSTTAVTNGFTINEVASALSINYPGNAAANTFSGFDGNDKLQGVAGNDTLNGAGGNDVVGVVFNPDTDEAGDDKFTGGAGNDTVNGGAGDDVVTGGLGDDVLIGASNNTPVTFNANQALLNGDVAVFSGNFDKYTVTFDKATSTFTLTGADGKDTATGFEFYTFDDKAGISQATLEALATAPPPPPPPGGGGTPSPNADIITATNAAGQQIDALAGADQVTGLGGPDTLIGGAGADALVGAGGNDSLDGGPGNDTINAGDGNDTVQGGADQDQVAGDAGNDLILLGDGNDFAVGGAGDDTIEGGGGIDQINGDAGNDSLVGGTEADQLAGGDGNDTLVAGADGIFLSGGAGADLFILTKGGTSTTSLADFQAGVDKLQLVGFGAGATLTANGNGTWTVKFAGGQFETFTAGAINPGDVTFVA